MLYASSSNYKILASSQITITDQTDAANLAGNISIVKGAKSQIYMTGSSSPYVPNWSLDNLVIRPHMIASNIHKLVGGENVNPDLFDPFLYPDLTNPGAPATGAGFIRNIRWFLIDASGHKTEINVIGEDGEETGTDSGQFSHTYTYKGDSDITLKDKRQLVIKDNILEKDEIMSIQVSFSFHDPYANISIPVYYSIDLMCISTGVGATKVVLKPVNGSSFYNGQSGTVDPGTNEPYLLAVSEYYKDGILEDPTVLEQLIANNRLSVEWSIRSGSTPGGWAILDCVNQDTNPFNDEELCYEICKVTGKTTDGGYTTQKTYNPNGGTALKIYRGLIAGMDVIKLTVTDDRINMQEASDIHEYFDYTDPTRVTIDSSSGDKLVGGAMGSDRSELKAIITHLGQLLEDDSTDYGENENAALGIFDYYWYRLSGDSTTTHNMWKDEYGNIHFTDASSTDYTPKKGTRRMNIGRDDIDKKAIFVLDIVDKAAVRRSLNKVALIESLPNPLEMREARIINLQNGIPLNDRHASIITAYELKAYNAALQNELVEKFYKRKR